VKADVKIYLLQPESKDKKGSVGKSGGKRINEIMSDLLAIIMSSLQ
jgi:hypothetical protein